MTRFYRRIQLECEEISDVNYKKFNELNSTGELTFKTDHNLGYSYYDSKIYQFSVSVGESITKMTNLIRKNEDLMYSSETEAKSFFDKLENVTDFYVHDQIRKKSFSNEEYVQFTTFKAFVNNDGNSVTYVIFVDRVYIKQYYVYCSQNAWGIKNCKTVHDKSLNDSDTKTFLLKGIAKEALGNSQDIFDEKKINVFS
jgi:hypothetical protein